jgi:hypothetical protein
MDIYFFARAARVFDCFALLAYQPESEFAECARQFILHMAPPVTEKEQIANELQGRAPESRVP